MIIRAQPILRTRLIETLCTPFKNRGELFSESFDVTHRRLADVAAVFPIELADTFVSDLKGHS